MSDDIVGGETPTPPLEFTAQDVQAAATMLRIAIRANNMNIALRASALVLYQSAVQASEEYEDVPELIAYLLDEAERFYRQGGIMVSSLPQINSKGGKG